MEKDKFQELLDAKFLAEQQLEKMRTPVTVLFSDIKGSTSYYEKHGDLAGIDGRVVRVGAVKNQQVQRRKVQRVRRCRIDTLVSIWMRIEQAEPAMAAATAQLVIAAHQNPGCRG